LLVIVHEAPIKSTEFPEEPAEDVSVDLDRGGRVVDVLLFPRREADAPKLLRRLAKHYKCPELEAAAESVGRQLAGSRNPPGRP